LRFPPLSAEKKAAIRRMLSEGIPKAHIAKRLGVGRQTVISLAYADRGKPEPAPSAFTRTESANEAKLEFAVRKPVVTLEDALARGQVDTKVWRVKRWKIVSGEVGMKLRSFDERGKVASEAPHTHPVWWVTLELERILPKPYHDATEAIFQRLESVAPKWPAPRPTGAGKAEHLIEIDLSDAHFGKLAWRPEAGDDYDLKIAERIYRNALDDLLSLVGGYHAARFVLPIGSDFYHIDTLDGTTTSGTHVDADGRYAKIIEIGEAAVIEAVARLAAIAPVDVLWIGGNHDRIASYHLARTVAAWFRQCDRVTVDYSPGPRKYVRHGTCLIGYTHGDKIAPKELPNIMAAERPIDWGATTCREFHRGHQHCTRVLTTTPVESYRGTVVRTLRALCYGDAWHRENGFIGSQPAAECHLYHESRGYVGGFVAPARDE